jgi:hypothetical protein
MGLQYWLPPGLDALLYGPILLPEKLDRANRNLVGTRLPISRKPTAQPIKH